MRTSSSCLKVYNLRSQAGPQRPHELLSLKASNNSDQVTGSNTNAAMPPARSPRKLKKSRKHPIPPSVPHLPLSDQPRPPAEQSPVAPTTLATPQPPAGLDSISTSANDSGKWREWLTTVAAVSGVLFSFTIIYWYFRTDRSQTKANENAAKQVELQEYTLYKAFWEHCNDKTVSIQSLLLFLI